MLGNDDCSQVWVHSDDEGGVGGIEGGRGGGGGEVEGGADSVVLSASSALEEGKSSASCNPESIVRSSDTPFLV